MADPSNSFFDRTNQFQSTAMSFASRNSSKPAWQIARDVSMNILSRKESKLSLKPDRHKEILTERNGHPEEEVEEKKTVVVEPKIKRIPRMPTEKQANEIMISYDKFCTYCGGAPIETYIRCRVCVKIYHSRCLLICGHAENPSAIFPRMANQDWTCPGCRNLTRLLSEEEIFLLMRAFEMIDSNKDGMIDLEELLSFRVDEKTSEDFEMFVQHNRQFGKQTFDLMDSRQTGLVAWSEFSFYYACKMIVGKTKLDLSIKLSEKELVKAKASFLKDPKKTFDPSGKLLVTRSHLKKIRFDLFLTLNEKYGRKFIESVVDFDPKLENLSEEEEMFVGWEEFISETCLFILLNRINKIKSKIKSNDDDDDDENREFSFTNSMVSTQLPPLKISTTNRSLTKAIRQNRWFNVDFDQSFVKHKQILQKLNDQEKIRGLKRKKIGSLSDYKILEDSKTEENSILPKLKTNQRDERNVIVDPWTSVRDLQRLRNQSIDLRTSR